MQRNPKVRIFGVTATPNRGDRKGLREVFSNVSDQTRIGELIASGHLVKPRTFVIDVGVQDDLDKVRRTAADFDMGEVDAIMNKAPVNDQVVRHWREKAGDRQTVVFCSTVNHAENVAGAFNADGVRAVVVYGEMADTDRRDALAAQRGQNPGRGQCRGADRGLGSSADLLRRAAAAQLLQVDHDPDDRARLRQVNPEEHPGVIKTDCIILDFGTSTLLLGSLEQDIDLVGQEPNGVAPTKDCPECGAVVPLAVMECSFCGHVWEGGGGMAVPLSDFIMSEIDLLKRSSFEWCDIFGDAALVANGFNAWAGIFFLNGRWRRCGAPETGIPSHRRRRAHRLPGSSRRLAQCQ